ncbi:hypothetical protein NHF40_02480 [Maricaulaceae bacterium EIL42A08]|nr:hypothetical protein [Maricaulaceae bacterium EIL42A08]
MSASLPQNCIRVVIHDADLELLIDGDGDHYATLYGVVSKSAVEDIAETLPFEITLGPYEGESIGLYIAPGIGGLTLPLAPEDVAGLKAQLAEARDCPGALTALIHAKGEPRSVGGGHGLHWWVADMVLEMRPPLSDFEAPDRDDRDLDATTRIRVETIEHGASVQMTGWIDMNHNVHPYENTPVSIELADGAANVFTVHDGTSTLTWPLRPGDADLIQDLHQRAEASKATLLLEVDLGHNPLSDNEMSWPVTDVGLLAVGLLAD